MEKQKTLLNKNITKVGLLCSGGDAPGINPYIRWLINNAWKYNIEINIIEGGFMGLYHNNFTETNLDLIESNYFNGGTLIKTSRFLELKKLEVQKACAKNLKNRNIETLIVVGGNGSYIGKDTLKNQGIRTIGVPETIDNNVKNSKFSLGFMTAVETAANSIKAIKESANSHNRCYIVEIMGDECGDLTKYAAIASKADLWSTPQEKLSFNQIADAVCELVLKGKKSIIIAITEKMHENYDMLIKLLNEKTDFWTRDYVLGFIQRGGSPIALERYLAANLAIATLKFINDFSESGELGIESVDNFKVTIDGKSHEIRLKNSDFFNLN